MLSYIQESIYTKTFYYNRVVTSYNIESLHVTIWVPVMEEDFIIYSDSLDESVALFETADESSLNTESR